MIIFHSYIENENKYFYYNKQRKISQWEHPLDEHYRQIVEKTRSEDSSTGKSRISFLLYRHFSKPYNQIFIDVYNCFPKH